MGFVRSNVLSRSAPLGVGAGEGKRSGCLVALFGLKVPLTSWPLAKLLVERVDIDRDEDGRVTVDITYRFGPPADAKSADGVQNSEEFARAHGRSGGEGLPREHPKMSSYEVAEVRDAGQYYGVD